MASMTQVSEDEFRHRFKLAFETKPDMSTQRFYDILESTGFNERAAMARVWQLVNDARRYAVPASLMDEEYISAEDCSVTQISDDEEVQQTAETPTGSDGHVSDPEMLLDNPFGGGGFQAPPDISLHQQDQFGGPRDGRAASRAKENEATSNSIKSGSHPSEAESTPDPRTGSQSIPRKKALVAIKSKNSTARTKTTVTKWIGRLAGGLYVRTMIICDGENVFRDEKGLIAGIEVEGSTLDSLIHITGDPKARRDGWSGRRVTTNIEMIGMPKKRLSSHDSLQKLGSIPDEMIYDGARLDGEIYRPGDYVTVRPGSDDALPKAKGKSEPKPASIWFACVVYLFVNSSTDFPCAHVRWLAHGGETILEEVAGPRELFLLDECENIPLGSIAGLVKVEVVTAIGPAEEMFTETNHYFIRQAYCRQSERFEDIDPKEKEKAILNLGNSNGCKRCVRHADIETLQCTSVISKREQQVDRISCGGVQYGVDDFVYILPTTPGKQYQIGQIRKFTTSGLSTWVGGQTLSFKVHATLFRRHDELQTPYLEEVNRGNGHGIRDNRRLFLTDEVTVVSDSRLDGRCLVRHSKDIDNLKRYKEADDAFYVADKVSHSGGKNRQNCLKDLKPLGVEEFRPSEDSEVKFVMEMSLREAFLAGNQKLRGMEIFAGAGGLATGFHRSEAIETRYAIEVDTAAANTFRHNFPQVKVYNHDANVLLRRAIEEASGRTLHSLKDLADKDMPCMPRPGDIDIIIGGPPCQDFSDLNRCRLANSIKNSLLTTYLSYVDFYRPKYFLLENVAGLLKHRLGSKQVNMNKVSGGIENGSMKFILRALTSMGYQATYSVLKSGEYGTPQSRARVIFWAALPGYTLPKFPEPTHVYSGARGNPTRHTRRSAPHLAVTVGDAITDLPSFDWKMNAVGGESRANNLAGDRRNSIPQVKVRSTARGDDGRIGLARPTYESSPRSEYQRELRRDVPEDFSRVENHFTCRWGDSIMERVLKIPMRPGANHLDLSVEEDLACLRTTAAAKSNSYYPSRYCRLDFENPFQTCLCDVDPSGDNGRVLHPSQHRVLTVREQARAQGFPDSFKWPLDQAAKEMYRQIGNAVAIPLGRALGNELLKVLIMNWQEGLATGTVASPVGNKSFIRPLIETGGEEMPSDDIEMTEFDEDTIVVGPGDGNQAKFIDLDESDSGFMDIDELMGSSRG